MKIAETRKIIFLLVLFPVYIKAKRQILPVRELVGTYKCITGKLRSTFYIY